VDRRVRVGGQAFPFRARGFEPIERIFAVERLDALAERRPAAARGTQLGFARVAFRACLRLAFDPFTDSSHRRLEPDAVVRRDVVRRPLDQLAPAVLDRGEAVGGVRRASRRAQRLGAGDRGRDALCVLLGRGLARGLRLVDGLNHGARALADRLAGGAIRELIQRRAILDARPLERGNTGVLMLRLRGDVQQFRGILDLLDCKRGDPAVGRVPRDGAERLHVSKAVHGVDPDAVDGRRLGDGADLLRVLQRRERVLRGRRGGRRGGDDGEPLQHLGPDAFVGVGRRDARQHLDVFDPLRSRAPDPRVGVFARERDQRCTLLLGGRLEPELTHGLESSVRIG
jgi:hypothetical protein